MSVSAIIAQLKTHQPKHVRLLQKLWATIGTNCGSFNELITILNNDAQALEAVKNNIESVFYKTDITYTLVDNGIYKRTGFGAELIRKLKHKILPELKNKNDFREPLEVLLVAIYPMYNNLKHY